LPRAPFNRVLSAYAGLRNPFFPAGTSLVVNVPCRIVPQTQIQPLEYPYPYAPAWVTCEGYSPTTVTDVNVSPGVLTCDFERADRVAISGLAGDWCATWAELVTPEDGPPYVRFKLQPYPLPF